MRSKKARSDFYDDISVTINDLQNKVRDQRLGTDSKEWELVDELNDLRNNVDNYDLEDAQESYNDLSPEAKKLAADALHKANESIKVINGKKYKAIKESKKNPRLFKEIYDRTFRSLK